MRAPKFWQHKGFLYFLLLPLSWIYSILSWFKFTLSRTYKAGIPVICVGNITLGGVGKTPVVQYIAKKLKSKNKSAAILMRGYRAKLSYVWVDPKKHSVEDVGDEALMHAKYADVFIGGDRKVGAKEIERKGYDVILMDDGFQNNTLAKDLSFLVFPKKLLLGNGGVFPAGPYRESLDAGLKRADGVIIIDAFKKAKSLKKPAFYGKTLVVKDKNLKLNGERFIAFSGIGEPDKFFNTLRKEGVELVNEISFPDHYYFKDNDLKRIIKQAKKKNAQIITTEKDYVRIFDKYKDKIKFIKIEISFDSDFDKYITKSLKEKNV
jgi:tetraacyldisaccharide 4'-kinase